MGQQQENYKLAQATEIESIPWETKSALVDSKETVPPQGPRTSNKYKDRYGRLHNLEDDVSYFLDPEDGIPKKVITQRSTNLDTVVSAAQSHDRTTREVVRDTGKFLVTEDSWVVLAAHAIRDKWSRDKDPPLPEDPQQLLQGTEAPSVGHFNAKWDRTRMKNKSSLAMQLIYWIYAGVPLELIAPQSANDEELSSVVAPGPSQQNIKTWGDLWRYDRKKFGWLILRYFFGTVVLTAMLIWPTSIEEPLRNGGNFDPIRCRDWDYPQNARNVQEQEDHNHDNVDNLGNSEGFDSKNNDCDQGTHQEAPPAVDKDGVEPSGMSSFTRPVRGRPPANLNYKDFQAFARLSLGSDSDRLLERLICLLPPDRSAPWHDWSDTWPGVKRWDIEPITQVAAIADNHTVVLDGAYGATIHWRKLHPVAFSKRKTAWREVVKWAIRLGAAYFITAVVLVATSPKPGNTTINIPNEPPIVIHQPTSPIFVIGLIFLILTILVLIYAPWAMLKIYRGKFWSTQGWFFGIEGCADIGKVEKCLFGCNHHRFKWSTNGSMLSRHHLGRLHNENGRECLPEEPAAASWKRDDFERERAARGGKERLYTLIDTYSMEATLFWAEVPPTAVFICGSEGGMKRAMLCSFDWKTNSFVRETVVRMKTIVVDKMLRVDRFRFALSRKMSSQTQETQ